MSTFDSVNKLWKGPEEYYPFDSNTYLGEEILKELCKSPELVMFINHEEEYSMTRGEARDLSINIAKNLAKLNFKPDDVVGIICKNSKYLPVLLYGCIIIGAHFNPLDCSFSKEDIKFMFKQTEPKIVFCDSDVYDKTKAALNELENDAKIYTLLEKIPDVPFIDEVVKSTGDNADFIAPKFEKNADQKIFGIICTSGTTGDLKGCCLSHASVLSLTNFIKLPFPFKSLFFSSVYWVSGLYSVLLLPFRTNETKIQTLQPFAPETLEKFVCTYKVDLMFLPSSHLYMLLQSTSTSNDDLQSLQLILIGGSSLTRILMQSFREKFPTKMLLNAYGLTEILSITGWKPGKRYKNQYSVGCLTSNIVIKIVDEDGNKLGVEECGEILVKPARPFLGYYNNPEMTANAIDHESFLKTGDIGYFDDDCSLVINDRKKDIFKHKTHYVNPSVIEKIILSIEGVAQVVVVGIRHLEFDFLPTAAVIKKRGFESLTEKIIIDTVAEKLVWYQHLHGGVFFRDSLPLTASGKIKTRTVRDVIHKIISNGLEIV